MRRHVLLPSRLALVFATAPVFLFSATSGTAQTPSASRPSFTIDDALNVVTYSQSDLSDDGRWLATVSSIRRDGLGVDYRRDGDPTYIRPAAGTVWVIETATGKARAVFPDKRNVRSLAWSPDGNRLAMLVLLQNDAFQP